MVALVFWCLVYPDFGDLLVPDPFWDDEIYGRLSALLLKPSVYISSAWTHVPFSVLCSVFSV